MVPASPPPLTSHPILAEMMVLAVSDGELWWGWNIVMGCGREAEAEAEAGAGASFHFFIASWVFIS